MNLNIEIEMNQALVTHIHHLAHRTVVGKAGVVTLEHVTSEAREFVEDAVRQASQILENPNSKAASSVREHKNEMCRALYVKSKGLFDIDESEAEIIPSNKFMEAQKLARADFGVFWPKTNEDGSGIYFPNCKVILVAEKLDSEAPEDSE